MSKVKIQEISEEAGLSNSELIKKAREIGLEVKTRNSILSDKDAEILMNYVLTGKKPLIKDKTKVNVIKKNISGINISSKKSTSGLNISLTPTKHQIDKIEKDNKSRDKIKQILEEDNSIRKLSSSPAKESIEKIEPIDKEINTDENTSEHTSIVKKKRQNRLGITVVRKSDKVISGVRMVNTGINNNIKSVTNLLNQAVLSPKKSKKNTTKLKAKDNGTKIQLLNERFLSNNSFNSSDSIYNEEEVILLDFSEKKIDKERPTNKKTPVKKTGKPTFKQKFFKKKRGKIEKYSKKVKNKDDITEVEISENIRVYEFAEKISKSISEVIKVLFTLGTMVTQNDFLDKDSLEILADEFNIGITVIDLLDSLDYVANYDSIENINNNVRPPVVIIMGHVDHGKTSILDKIRSTKIAAKESGGITQHIGAYQIEQNNKKISFIDTPGHAAFSAMRSKGVQATDIIIIVVAVDDGIKEQTKEVIKIAKQSKLPIIIAMNKIDKDGANIEKVKSQFSELDIVSSDWGGKYDFIPLSAHTGEGIDELLSTILIQSEVSELFADEEREAKALVIESYYKQGFGAVANIIMRNGSLKIGDYIVAGRTFGRVKTIILDNGDKVKKIGPSTPASIIGLNSAPETGEVLISMDSEKDVKEIATKLLEYKKSKELSKSTKVTLDNFNEIIKESNLTSLPVVIKVDVDGSLEAVKSTLEDLRNDEVKVNIIYSGVGNITESDILLAQGNKNTLILGFNTKISSQVKAKAKNLSVNIQDFKIIYELLDFVKEKLSGLMAPIVSIMKVGEIEVKEIYTVAKIGTIAGSKVISGLISKDANIKLIRDGEEIIETTIHSLKRFNDDVKEVKKGFECGIMLHKFNDIKAGDIIEVYKEVKKSATIDIV